MTAATDLQRRQEDYLGPVLTHLDELVDRIPEPLLFPARELARNAGKCTRARMVASCGQAAVPGLVVRLGALVELVHLASLLHDDVVDRAAVRRGEPSAYVSVGREAATLAGLACFAQAGMEAADIGAAVSVAVSRTVAELTQGELLDIERAFDVSLTLADYQELCERKTGALFHLACVLGASAAGRDAEEVRLLGRFGAEIGVAFQILDDCLDLAETGHGKPVGTDHLLGLFGAPALCALRADPSGELVRLLLSAELTTADLPRVRALIITYGGLHDAKAMARERYTRAFALLGGLDDQTTDALTAATATVWCRL
jgi:geranylgeranyl pyrophosphate synthase